MEIITQYPICPYSALSVPIDNELFVYSYHLHTRLFLFIIKVLSMLLAYTCFASSNCIFVRCARREETNCKVNFFLLTDFYCHGYCFWFFNHFFKTNKLFIISIIHNELYKTQYKQIYKYYLSCINTKHENHKRILYMNKSVQIVQLLIVIFAITFNLVVS